MTTAEDTSLSVSIPVHAGANSQLMVTIATPPSHGTVTATEGDVTTWSYTPALNYDGSDSFVASVSDGTNTATGTVNITVTAVDDAPVAGAAMFTTPVDTALTIDAAALLANDTDVESDALSITTVQDALNGTVTMSGTTITFTPENAYFGVTTFTYTVSDGQLSTTGTVSINVGGNNHAPVATDDSATTLQNVPLVVSTASLLANDTDPDGNTLRITAVSNGQHGTPALDTIAGTVTFTPDVNFHGTASFDYTVDDGNGGTDTGTVTVAVTHVNQAPVANQDSLTIAQNTVGSVDVLANDTDADGDGLSVAAFTQGAHGTVTFTGGTATYTPAAGFSGADSFTYTISDGNGGSATGTVTVTVTGVNQSPVAINDSLTVGQDTSGNVDLLANDSDPNGDPLTITANTFPANGVVSFTGGVATYTPNAGFIGSDGFTYTISDGRGGTATASVTINVIAVNHPPAATNDLLALAEDATGTVNVTANDRDPDGDPITITNFTQPAHGTVTFAGSVATYKPVANFNGIDAFSYTISDGRGGTATGIVSVTVSPVNDAPVAVNDTLATDENSPGSVDVTSNDSDVDGDALTITTFTQPAHGTVAFSNSVALYTPVPNFTGTDTFSYTISDGHGASASAFVHVTVTPGTTNNTDPVANPDTFTGNEDTVITGNVLTNDTGTPLLARLVTGPSHVGEGGFSFSANGVFSYTGAPNFNGTDSFTYTVDNGTVTADPPVTVTIHVLPVNDAPVALSETLTENPGALGPFVVTLSATDVDNLDSPPAGDTFTFQIVSPPSRGTLSAVTGNTVSYTPGGASGFVSPDSFTFTATDNHGAVSAGAATVSLVLPPVPACGDGILGNTAGEQCDDGNTTGGDGCEPDCTFTCGNFSSVNGDTFTPNRVAVDRDTGSCFAFYASGGPTFTQAPTYAQAATACVTLGGHLATIEDFDEQVAASTAVSGGEGQPWLGANDITGGGEQWISGETFQLPGFDPFANGTLSGGACVQFSSDEFDWTTASCSKPNQGGTANGAGLECEFDLFPTQNTYTTTTGSQSAASVVTADFNDDGRPDIAYLDPNAFQVDVMLGDGLGGFHPQSPLDLGQQPTALAAGDLDGDGHPDLVVTEGNDTVDVWLNNKDATFTEDATYGAASGSNGPGGPVAVMLVDLNNNRFLDVAVANKNTRTVGVLLGTGNGALNNVTEFNVVDGDGASASPVAIAAGLIDTFADIGLATANEQGSVTVFAFAPPPVAAPFAPALVPPGEGGSLLPFTPVGFSVGGTPDAIAIGDYDGDGNPDVAFGRSDATQLGVIVGDPTSNGEGGFQPGFDPNAVESDFEVGTPVTSLANGPVRNDITNNTMLVFGSLDAHTVTIDGAEGGNSLADGGSLLPPARIGLASDVSSLALADFNGDGVLDAVTTGDNTTSITELSGTPPVQQDFVVGFGFGPASTTLVGNNPNPAPGTLIAADLHDVDSVSPTGGPDLVVVNSADNSITIIPNDGSSPQTIPVGSAPSGIAAGDLDGDGLLDLVVTNAGDNSITVLFNTLGAPLSFTAQSPVPVGSGPAAVAIADMDGDANHTLDVVVALNGASKVVVLTNDGTGTLTARAPIAAGLAPIGLALGDVNSAGGPDVVITDGNGNRQLLLNAASGTFAAQAQLPLPSSAISLADLNGDGKLDIVVVDTQDGQTFVGQGHGGGDDFDNPFFASSPFGGGPTSAVLADLDGDGFLDLAIANNAASSVSVFLNFGTQQQTNSNALPPGSFVQPPRTIALGAGAFGIVSGDFDGNKHPDLAVSDGTSDGVEVVKSPR